MELLAGRADGSRRGGLAAGFLAIAIAALSCGLLPSPPPEVTVVMSDFAFEPSKLNIQRAEKTIIRLENQGTVEHTFTIPQLKVESARVPPGRTGSVEVSAPRGPLRIVCIIPGHEEAGMVGELAIERRR